MWLWSFCISTYSSWLLMCSPLKLCKLLSWSWSSWELECLKLGYLRVFLLRGTCCLSYLVNSFFDLSAESTRKHIRVGQLSCRNMNICIIHFMLDIRLQSHETTPTDGNSTWKLLCPHSVGQLHMETQPRFTTTKKKPKQNPPNLTNHSCVSKLVAN